MSARVTPSLSGAARPATALLRAVGLTKTYQSGEVEIHALRGVDFEIHSGELVVLVGPSGSGKSTLLNILGGLDTATRGQAFFEDLELTACSEQERTRYRRHNVGFVFQFYNLIPGLTAAENVALVTELAEDPMDEAEALELVGLGPRMHHFPAQLSGGEQQRVAIARAIAKRPALLLCDEPTGALDSETGVLVLEALETVNREVGSATALITHNREISEMADRVMRFGDGRIVETRVNEERVPARELRW